MKPRLRWIHCVGGTLQDEECQCLHNVQMGKRGLLEGTWLVHGALKLEGRFVGVGRRRLVVELLTPWQPSLARRRSRDKGVPSGDDPLSEVLKTCPGLWPIPNAEPGAGCLTSNPGY